MISFRELDDKEETYQEIYEWCQNKSVYEWFEQRQLSLEEVKEKYKKKKNDSNITIMIIQKDYLDIGIVQIYPFAEDENTYEFDLFIGDENYQSIGIGTEVVNIITEKIFEIDKIDSIILRPFKKNIRAIGCYVKCGYKKIMEYVGSDSLGYKVDIMVFLKRKYDNDSENIINE